jgi:hypothetical protein
MIRVSNSQLGQFDRCHFAWHLGYEQGWAAKEVAQPLALGSFVHELLAIYYRNKDNVDPDEFINLASENYLMEAGSNLQKLEIVQRGLTIVKRYIPYAKQQDKHWNVIDVEKRFEIPLVTPMGVEYVLEGIIDLLYATGNGNLWLVDHKTVGHGKFWSDIEILMEPQMPTYAAGLRELGMPIFGITYNMLNTYEYKNKIPLPDQVFKRLNTHKTDQELANHLINMGNTVDEMVAVSSGNVRKRSMKRECSYCQFQDPCLAAVKGIDPLPLLEANFKNKKELQLEAVSSQQIAEVTDKKSLDFADLF